MYNFWGMPSLNDLLSESICIVACAIVLGFDFRVIVHCVNILQFIHSHSGSGHLVGF